MKKNISIILLLVCTMGFLWSCEKEIDLVRKVSTTEDLAFIKIVHAAPNFTTVFKGADNFNVYVNGAKINGGALTYNTTGLPFLFPVATNLYAGVPAGPQSIRISVNGTTTPDSITLASFNKTLERGGYYSFIMTDEALTGNESRQIWIRDNFALVDTNNFTLRMVHAVLNETGAVDVYSFRRAANIFTNVNPTTATPFISLPYIFITDTFYVRPAGTLTNIAQITVSTGTTGGGTTNRGRAHTLVYRGQVGNTAKPRSLTLFANN